VECGPGEKERWWLYRSINVPLRKRMDDLMCTKGMSAWCHQNKGIGRNREKEGKDEANFGANEGLTG
jgi:hypothetical protein